jgi:hypothetical protein
MLMGNELFRDDCTQKKMHKINCLGTTIPKYYAKMDAALYLYAFQYVVFLGVQYSWCILPTDTIFHTTGCPLFLCKHMTTLCFQRAAVVDCQDHGPLNHWGFGEDDPLVELFRRSEAS